MADNEKLDNQRLKNFKNKGRDLEVKVVLDDRRRVPPLLASALALCFAASFDSWLPCDVVSNSFYRKLCAESLGRGACIQRLLKTTGGLGSEFAGYNPAALVMKHVRGASPSSPRPCGKHASPVLAHSRPGLVNPDPSFLNSKCGLVLNHPPIDFINLLSNENDSAASVILVLQCC